MHRSVLAWIISRAQPQVCLFVVFAIIATWFTRSRRWTKNVYLNSMLLSCQRQAHWRRFLG